MILYADVGSEEAYYEGYDIVLTLFDGWTFASNVTIMFVLEELEFSAASS